MKFLLKVQYSSEMHNSLELNSTGILILKRHQGGGGGEDSVSIEITATAKFSNSIYSVHILQRISQRIESTCTHTNLVWFV